MPRSPLPWSARRRRRGVSTRFVIFGQGRTGSSLLRQLLNQHPDVLCDGEILAEHLDDPVRLVLDRAEQAPNRAYGFKVKIYQLTEAQQIEPAEFLAELDRREFVILYLRRENLLRHAISNAFAEQRGRYHDRAAESESRPSISLDVDGIVDAIHRRRAHLEAESRALEGRVHHDLVYERDLLDARNHQETMDRVFEILGLPSMAVEADLARSVSGSLQERIANYAELAAALEREGLGAYLDDPSYDTTR